MMIWQAGSEGIVGEPAGREGCCGGPGCGSGSLLEDCGRYTREMTVYKAY